MSTEKTASVFITAIDTDAGKTLVSAMLCEAFGLDYWKPVQCGGLDRSDSMVVGEVIGEDRVIPEQWRLKKPASPHDAASEEGVELSLDDIQYPTSERLLVEGAGGPMVPLNLSGDFVIDIPRHVGIPVILVTRHYLGSINHTTLCIEVMKSRGIELAGIIVNGEQDMPSEEVYFTLGAPVLAHIPKLEDISAEGIRRAAAKLKENKLLHELFQDR